MVRSPARLGRTYFEFSRRGTGDVCPAEGINDDSVSALLWET
jgi:hypothetical protein